MILFNGCSFVWGDELPGYDDSPPSHIPLRFSTKLAAKSNFNSGFAVTLSFFI